MVGFDLSEDLTMLRDTARDFADKELVPNAARWDRELHFPREALEKAAELGFLGMNVPEEYGGNEMGSLGLCVLLEEINRGCASTGVTISVHNSLFCSPVVKFGTEEQKQKFLPKMAKGEALGGYCLSEAGAGSDAASLRCSAKKDGDDWILDGAKLWITTGSEADAFIVFARTSEHRTRGISAFIVESTSEGFKVGKKEEKLGIRASPTTEILFENCRIPGSHLLGEEGIGFKIALDTLDGGRLGIASQSVGIGRAALEEALRYAKTREQFGKPIGEFQAVGWKLADMGTDIDAARLLTWRAAWLRDQKLPCSKEAAMAKSFASRAANRAARDCVQIHGGAGYTQEFIAERLMRDARITEIYEGATDIQRLVISRHLLAD
ncbi:MAG: acyl-CoA dehydrogenase [Planctomycetota bacterium]|nr:MAG: acyl-CoA dehydrogenase [Planctomycetota bacterium]